MSSISLLTVGTGTLSPKWPVKPTFQPSEQGNNARAQGNGKFLYKALSKPKFLPEKRDILLIWLHFH